MSWTDDSGRHEGYLECLFEDGWAGGGWSDGGVTVTVDPSGHRVPYDAWTSRPQAEVISWRLACNHPDGTTWRSDHEWIRVPSQSLEDLAAHRIFAPDDDAGFVDDRDDVHAAVIAQWHSEHVDPLTSLDEIGSARREVAEATRRLDQAVARARVAEMSWEAIGKAAGISRQSAHERWGDHRRHSG